MIDMNELVQSGKATHISVMPNNAESVDFINDVTNTASVFKPGHRTKYIVVRNIRSSEPLAHGLASCEGRSTAILEFNTMEETWTHVMADAMTRPDGQAVLWCGWPGDGRITELRDELASRLELVDIWGDAA